MSWMDVLKIILLSGWISFLVMLFVNMITPDRKD